MEHVISGSEKQLGNTEDIFPLANIRFAVQRHPLLIDTVLRCLFRFVNYETLKECRLVCNTWKEACDFQFLLSSTFSFNCRNVPWQYLESSDDIDILSLFESITQQEVRFSSFKFIVNKDLKTSQLDPYLESSKLRMLHLEISCDSSASSKPQGRVPVINDFDSLIGPQLRELKLQFVGSGSTVNNYWRLSLTKLSSNKLQEINLNQVTIVPTPDGMKMTPKELCLTDWRFLGSKNVTSLSEFINFRHLQKLELNDGPTTSILNLSHCAHIKILILRDIKIKLDGKISPQELTLQNNRYLRNGEEVPQVLLNGCLSSTHFKKITLRDMSVIVDYVPGLSIDELELLGTGFPTRGTTVTMKSYIKKITLASSLSNVIDFSLLPRTVEYLDVESRKKNNSNLRTADFDFPNLNQLIFTGNFSYLEYFKDCPSIYFLGLSNLFFQSEVFTLDHMPQNVKKLKLKDTYKLKVFGNKIYTLEVLALAFSNWRDFQVTIPNFLKEIQNKIFAELVVFHCLSNPNSPKQYLTARNIEEIMTIKLKLSIEKLAFGPVTWGNLESFKKSQFFLFVDCKSEYYLFEGQRGKGISEFEFFKLIE